MRNSLRKALRDNGFRLTETPDSDIGLIRVAITDVQKSKWYLNLHPATKLTGAGLGGASMEGEVVDSVTGKQLGAVVQSGKGNQFELDTFSELDDVKDVIDRWTEAAGKRLRELRERARRGACQMPFSISSSDEPAVLARLRRANRWKEESIECYDTLE